MSDAVPPTPPSEPVVKADIQEAATVADAADIQEAAVADAADIQEAAAADVPASAAADVPASAAVDVPASAAVDVPASAAVDVPASAVKEEEEAVEAVEAAVVEPAPQPVVEDVIPEEAISPMAKLYQELSSMNLFEGKTKEQIVGIREEVEYGLQAFNQIEGACQIMHDAIVDIAAIKANGVRFNPDIGRLADFVDHCKLLVSTNGPNAELVAASVSTQLNKLAEDARLRKKLYKLTVDQAKIGDIGTQVSLVLKIGDVFNVPVFTVYVLQDVFDNTKFDSAQSTQNVLASPLTHNLKTIATCSRADLMLELLLHATKPDPYDEVNVLIAHIINETIVSKFKDPNPNPNEVIAAEREQLFDLIIANNPYVKSLITKALLIAIIQNPSVMTPDGNRFSDMFPSGQYVQYFGDVVHRATRNPQKQGPIMLPNVPTERAVVVQADDELGEAPGFGEPVPPRPQPSHPMTRTDIIVAALTAVNDAMGRNANIVAAGGAAVSYYIADFVRGLRADKFTSVITESGLDLGALEKGCAGIPMNDIDCFVFGDVSRQFLMLFSLYIMILYANFYERPRKYGVEQTQVTHLQFKLSPQSDANIDLFMYGNNNDDANTKLISKKLKKNPKVQLVTQETKCFSQLSSMLCGDLCTVDGYYTQPIDLVKKDIDDFLVLYESLYLDAREEMPDLRALLTSQYAANVDNMVSMKTTMLDLVCIFCNEDKALFIRIFMARKNPKDFARLRVFIEIYLLELLRKKDAAFLEHKEGLIREIKELRVMMSALNEKYYLEQGNLAAVHAATAEVLNDDRAVFLTLLRSIGRKFVLIPDPLQNKIPATFRKETGRKTIEFFEDRHNEQMKYPFSMGRHMVALHGTYIRVSSKRDAEQNFINRAFKVWLDNVFQELPFIPKVEQAFREKMGQIIDKTQDQTYFEVGFSNMIVRSPEMLRLFTLLNQVKGHDAMFKSVKGKDKRAFTRMLLGPLRKIITRDGGAQPKASYVLQIYDTKSMETLPAFVRSVIQQELEPTVAEIINRPNKYDNAVNEAIGRIILEWNRTTSLKGGATRKHKRVCKRNAMTRRRVSKGKRRATHKAFNKKRKHARTRRA